MLQAWFSLLDMGMTPTLNREMARYSAGAHSVQSIRDLLRTLEIICFAMALLIGVTIWLAADWVANHWLHANKIPLETIAQAIFIMGIVVGLRLLEGFYRSAIMGLEKQVWLGIATSVLATIRSAGAVAVLVWIKSDIESFFVWQCLISIFAMITFMLYLYNCLPKSSKTARFSWLQLKSISRFAGGMMFITLQAVLLMHLDKIILSRILTLEMFAYYSLAAMVIGVFFQMVDPVIHACFPRFTDLITRNKMAALIKLFHQNAQFISILVMPIALMLLFFSEPILLLWIGNLQLAQTVAPMMSLMALGSMFNSFMHLPVMLSFSYNWVGFAISQNTVAIIFLIPAIFWASLNYGGIGVAWIWLILNSCYFLISAQFFYKRLLSSEKYHWYCYDIIFPLISALAVVSCFSWLKPDSLPKITEIVWLIITWLCVATAAALSVTEVRHFLVQLTFKNREIA
jgi:O-antigen/teichoic acid export membrane protein